MGISPRRALPFLDEEDAVTLSFLCIVSELDILHLPL